MNEHSYLNPIDIKNQCNIAISKLQRDNEALCKVEESLDIFINDDV